MLMLTLMVWTLPKTVITENVTLLINVCDFDATNVMKS